MSLKSRTRKPPCGWIFREEKTGWEVTRRNSEQLVKAILAHRVENSLKRLTLEEIWQDIEAYICDQLRGKWALWDYCNTKMPRPQRASAPNAEAVNPFPVRGQKTKGSSPKAQQIMDEINARKAENAAAKKEGRAPRRPCKTCGKRSGS